MSKLTLDQFKIETDKTNSSRLTLDQFKAKSLENETKEELEKLTGGSMASCHSSSNPLGDYVNDLWNKIKWP